MYGDVPYTDALKGVENLAPKLDNQKTVYETLITLLDEAIAETKANPFSEILFIPVVIFYYNKTFLLAFFAYGKKDFIFLFF